jgi:hypothetical protein
MSRYLVAVGFLLLSLTHADARTLVAVGTELGDPLPAGGAESWPFVLRQSDGAWTQIRIAFI